MTVTTTGSITAGNALSITTGNLTVTAGNLILSAGSFNPAGSAGTSGQVLLSAGSGTPPTWGSIWALPAVVRAQVRLQPMALYGNGTSPLQVTAAGAANTFLTSAGGAPSFNALNINSTLTGNGIGTALGINLATANTWTNEITVAPTANGTTALLVKGTSGGGTADIFDVQSSGGTNYISLSSAGNIGINANNTAAGTTTIGTSTAAGKVTIGNLGTPSQGTSKIDLESSGLIAINNAKPSTGVTGGISIGNGDATHGSGNIDIESGTGSVSINIDGQNYSPEYRYINKHWKSDW